jgi:hypothetical protein
MHINNVHPTNKHNIILMDWNFLKSFNHFLKISENFIHDEFRHSPEMLNAHPGRQTGSYSHHSFLMFTVFMFQIVFMFGTDDDIEVNLLVCFAQPSLPQLEFVTNSQ